MASDPRILLGLVAVAICAPASFVAAQSAAPTPTDAGQETTAEQPTPPPNATPQPPPPAPPPQYPQQYPPQYPQQYPPQYPQQYPPQYPQQYPPQYPQQPYQAEPPRKTSGFSPSLFLGLHTLLGDYGEGTGPGLRLGGVLAGRFNASFALGGELALDILNLDGSETTAVNFYINILPTFYLPFANGEFMLSPKLGIFGLGTSTTFDGQTFESSGSGHLFGVNAGAGFVVGRLLMGPLLMIEHQSITEVCADEGFGEECVDTSDFDGYSGMVVSLNFAMWF